MNAHAAPEEHDTKYFEMPEPRNPMDWFRYGIYTLALVCNLVAIFIEPVSAEWVEPFTQASNVLAAVAGGTALTYFTKGKQ